MKLSSLIMSSIPKIDHHPSDGVLVDDNMFVGVEIELEGVLMGKPISSLIAPKYWKVEDEGSIREGAELIFSSPLQGSQIVSAMSSFRDFLDNFNSYTNRFPVISDRCSLHVHVDVSDMELQQIHTMTILYGIYEKVFFQLLNPSRYNLNYCIPIVSSNFGTVFNKIAKSSISDYLVNIEVMCDKYSNLNYKSILKFGSLEFRGHPGTLNPNEIIDWINILLSIKKWSIGNTLDQLKVKELNASLLTKEVFEKNYLQIMTTNFFQENFKVGKYWALETLSYEDLKANTINELNKTNTGD